ncbi:polysaccharide deacetylase family protein [Clostridium sp. KNHs214]|uniref:polysaccharide deacetylase family protein n=1 Tax=Clostridium sp. KNHs214 TaxID=1540257 RepID=UPI000555DDF6|nr:polysaccharide deacetylase family protein [Clostridium sp. KNHs214]
MRNRKIRKNNNKKFKTRRILLAVSVLMIVTTGAYLTKSVLNKKSKKSNVQVLSEKNSDKKGSKDKNSRKQYLTEEEPRKKEIKKSNPEDILKAANVTVEGNKYAYDAKKIEETLKSGKAYVDGKKIAFLTFDDGPSTTVTPKILDILKENNLKATFFIVGNSLETSDGAKEILKRTIKEGHAIGNHTYSHNYKHLYPGRFVNANNFMNEIDQNERIMKSVLGEDFHTRVVRFPGGHMSWKGTEGIDKVMNDRNYAYIDWNALSGDAEGRRRTPEQLAARVKGEITENCKPDRVVVLMHDTYGKENTAKSLQEIINHLKSLGYEFKTLK